MKVSANVTYKEKIEPGILVRNIADQAVGIVTNVTRHFVHVTWLAAQEHKNLFHHRYELEVCPPGTKVTIEAKA